MTNNPVVVLCGDSLHLCEFIKKKPDEVKFWIYLILPAALGPGIHSASNRNDPFQTHYFSENLVAPGMEPGTPGSVARNSDH
jgi:hypothetical protein